MHYDNGQDWSRDGIQGTDILVSPVVDSPEDREVVVDRSPQRVATILHHKGSWKGCRLALTMRNLLIVNHSKETGSAKKNKQARSLIHHAATDRFDNTVFTVS